MTSDLGKATVTASQKLAGNQLESLAAFLSALAQDDWTWVGWTPPPHW